MARLCASSGDGGSGMVMQNFVHLGKEMVQNRPKTIIALSANSCRAKQSWLFLDRLDESNDFDNEDAK